MVDQKPLEEVITLVPPTVPIRNNERPTTNLVEEPRTKGRTREFLELGINRAERCVARFGTAVRQPVLHEGNRAPATLAFPDDNACRLPF